MGVRDLPAVVLRHAPSAIAPRSFASFANSTLAIDGNLQMTKFHHVGNVKHQAPDPHKHVKAWYKFLRALRREGIRPIVVLDGDARVPEKAAENARRRAARELQRQRGLAEMSRGARLASLRTTWANIGAAKNEVLLSFKEVSEGVDRTVALEEEDENTLQTLLALHNEAEDDRLNPLYTANQKTLSREEEIFFYNIVLEASSVVEWEEGLGTIQERSRDLSWSHQQRAESVPSSAYEETIQLLEMLGIPWIKPSSTEPHEAEAICATLYSLGLADGVISEDTDVAVYGAPLIRKFTTQHRPTPRVKKNGSEPTANDSMHILDPLAVHRELGLTPETFLDFALLLGTDFTVRLPFVGPEKALSLIRAHGSIEAILTSGVLKCPPPDPVSYLASVVAARKLFLNLPPLPANTSLDVRPERPGLRAMLRGWGIYDVDPEVPEDVFNDTEEDGARDLEKELSELDLGAAGAARDRRLMELAMDEADRFA